MSKFDDAALELHNNDKALLKMAKDRAFDLIAVGLILAVGLINLGAIELRQITIKDFANLALEAIPFYMASVALAVNFYKKGTWAGKSTDGFIEIIKFYSEQINKLTGKQLDFVNDFCIDFNEKAVKLLRQNILRDVSISYERYAFGFDGKRPLCQLSHRELVKSIGERGAQAVDKANKVKIKGLSPSVLLGGGTGSDITDLGKTEQELLKSQTRSYALSFGFSTVLFVLMGVKDIMQWGWLGVFLIVFKLLFILCRCYMEYFKGYEDITVRVVSHVSRKNDILKQFDYWYHSKCPEESNDIIDSCGNISDNSIIYYNNEGCKTGDDGTSPKNVEGVLNGQ